MNEHTGFFVGINVLTVRDGKLLLGKRKSGYGEGDWGLPGGHMEPRERMEQTAARELEEETGLKANKFEFSNLVNDAGHEEVHRIQVGFVAVNVGGEPVVKELDRCYEWQWFLMGELPKNIFKPHIKQIENFLDKKPFSNTSL
ncbi:MAG: NUDIX domain-containing protein [bacterium]|nr:NUDIX domain-containing protein [bacterium]